LHIRYSPIWLNLLRWLGSKNLRGFSNREVYCWQQHRGYAFLDFCESKQGQTHEKVWHNILARSFVPIEEAKEDYKNGKFLFEPTGKDDHSSIRNNSYYGEALIPLEYIEKEYTSLNLVDFVKEQTKLPQALFVMQKPS
jgi:hypothetical protein